MSATTTPPVANAPALISSSPANQATAAASGLSSGGLMVIVIWLLSLVHISVPPEVASALVGLIGTIVHWAVLKYGMTTPGATP